MRRYSEETDPTLSRRLTIQSCLHPRPRFHSRFHCQLQRHCQYSHRAPSRPNNPAFQRLAPLPSSSRVPWPALDLHRPPACHRAGLFLPRAADQHRLFRLFLRRRLRCRRSDHVVWWGYRSFSGLGRTDRCGHAQAGSHRADEKICHPGWRCDAVDPQAGLRSVRRDCGSVVQRGRMGCGLVSDELPRAEEAASSGSVGRARWRRRIVGWRSWHRTCARTGRMQSLCCDPVGRRAGSPSARDRSGRTVPANSQRCFEQKAIVHTGYAHT